MPLLQTKTLSLQRAEDWQSGREKIRLQRYGVIETAASELVAIHFRRWPKLLAWPEIFPVRAGYHSRGETDRCLLYYNQPRRHPSFLALRYIVSTLGTRYATFRVALITLDVIAQVKCADALLCDAANSRISDRLMRRFGWEPHKPQRWHRNYIKRFYGDYPAQMLPLPAAEC